MKRLSTPLAPPPSASLLCQALCAFRIVSCANRRAWTTLVPGYTTSSCILCPECLTNKTVPVACRARVPAPLPFPPWSFPVIKSLARSQAARRRAAVAVASVGALLMASSWLEGVATGETITYITPTSAANSNANWPATNGTYTQNFGIAFTTGNSGPFAIDWVHLGLNSSANTANSTSLTIALRNTTNTTA